METTQEGQSYTDQVYAQSKSQILPSATLYWLGLLGAVEMVPLEGSDLKPWNLDMHYKTKHEHV